MQDVSITQEPLGDHRLREHALLGSLASGATVRATVDGRELVGVAGEPIAAMLLAHGLTRMRTLPGSDAPRGLFCGVGRCADCLMSVDGELNVRVCVTPLRDGMRIETQHGLGDWKEG